MLPLFYRQVIPLAEQAFTLGGSNITFNLPRESVIDQVNVYIEGTIGTAANVAAVEGLPKLISSVSCRGSIRNAPAFEPINGLTGPDLFEIAQFQRGSLPHTVATLGAAATTRFRINLPLYFREFFLSNELKNLLPSIPAFAMSDLTLSIKPAAVAEVDVGTGTLVINNTVIGCEVFQYYRNTVPDNIQFLRGQYEVLEDNGITTQSDREIKLPSGGDYTLLLARSFSGANARQADMATAPAAPMTGTIKLYDLARFTKMETSFQKLRADNLPNILDTLVTGNAGFIFNRGETSVFQTGQLGEALNNVTLNYNATAAANSKVRFVYRRLLDSANLLGIPR